MIPVLAVIVGLVLGITVGIAFLHRSASVRADGLYREWRADEAADIARGAADDARLASKTAVGTDLPGGASLPFFAADAHFVGHPVHLIVFDGDSEVKAGVTDELREVVLVTFGTGTGGGDRLNDAELVAECVADGRVRWETIRPEQPLP